MGGGGLQANINVSLGEKDKLIVIKLINSKLDFLTILIKPKFVAEKNSADNFSVQIQSCFNSKVLHNGYIFLCQYMYTTYNIS